MKHSRKYRILNKSKYNDKRFTLKIPRGTLLKVRNLAKQQNMSFHDFVTDKILVILDMYLQKSNRLQNDTK